MVRIITIGLISCFLFSCGNSRNFNTQKYTSLKKTKVNQHSDQAEFSNDDLPKNSTTPVWEQNPSLELATEENGTINSYPNSAENKNEPTEIYEQNKQETQINDNESLETFVRAESNSNLSSSTNSDHNSAPLDKKEKGTERNTVALWAFIFLCASIFPWFLPVAFTLAIIAKVQIKKNPNKYRNKWMAEWAFWFPIACLIAFPIIGLIALLQ